MHQSCLVSQDTQQIISHKNSRDKHRCKVGSEDYTYRKPGVMLTAEFSKSLFRLFNKREPRQLGGQDIQVSEAEKGTEPNESMTLKKGSTKALQNELRNNS